MTVDLEDLLPEVFNDAPAGVYNVAAIPGFLRHYVGRDDKGRACVLLGSVDTGTRAPVRLGGLEIQYALTSIVRMGECAATTHVLTVVTCTGSDPEAERYFLHILATMIGLIGEAPTLVEVAEAVTQLAGIFQRLTLDARESIAGIVGELVLVSGAADVVAAISAWRSDPDERYDFVTGKLRLEVKSSLTRRRNHDFSFEQCDVPVGCRGIVASTFVEKTAGGLSLGGLIGLINQRLAAVPQAVFSLHQTLADTLGAGLAEALGFSFDYDLARNELAFYDLETIPAIRRPLNAFLSQVRFTSNLGSAKPLDRAAISLTCPDFAPFTAYPH